MKLPKHQDIDLGLTRIAGYSPGHKWEILKSLLGNPMVKHCQSPDSGFSKAEGHSSYQLNEAVGDTGGTEEQSKKGV